ncbi:MAG: DUF6569 family protein, partial [Bacteroidota bacterium]
MKTQLPSFLSFFILFALVSCMQEEHPSHRQELFTPSAHLRQEAAFHAAVSLPTQEFGAIIGPYVKDNLQVFFIEGEQVDDRNYLTLEEALKKGYVKVNESGNVQQLSVDNNSDEYIFIHSGDIVKGGKQDRTLQQDLVLEPRANGIPLASFCVEQNRWSARGNASVGHFGESKNLLPSRELKFAANYIKRQDQVWENVSKQQVKLNEKLSEINDYDVEVEDEISASSLELSLENEELEKAKTALHDHFLPLLGKHPNATGFVYAVNGEIYGADVYHSTQLFAKLWPKLLESAIVESVSEKEAGKSYANLAP